MLYNADILTEESILREIIRKTTIPDYHVTIRGARAKFGSPQCIKDLEFRVGDAKRSRDAYPHRSDARVHYNGLLRVLRRELRSAIRVSNKI